MSAHRSTPVNRALGLTISSARAAILTVDGGGQLTGATNVDLGSLGFFNVTFLDGTCIDLFTGCDTVSDFDFASSADAQTAASALLNQVFIDNHISAPALLFDSSPDLTAGCGDIVGCSAIIPFGFDPPGSLMLAAFARNFNTEFTDIVGLIGIPPAMDFALSPTLIYADFTMVAAVPLPPAALLFVTALVGLAGMARRRQA